MVLIAMIALYLLFLPPLISGIPAAAYDYAVDDSTPTVELPGKQCPFTSSPYRLSVYTLSIFTRHFCFYLLPIQLHSLSLSPLITILISYAAYINIIQQLALRFPSQLGLDSGP